MKCRDYLAMADPDLPAPRGETCLTVPDIATPLTEAEKIVDSSRLTVRGAKVGATPICPQPYKDPTCNAMIHL